MAVKDRLLSITIILIFIAYLSIDSFYSKVINKKESENEEQPNVIHAEQKGVCHHFGDFGQDDTMYGAYQIFAKGVPKETLDFFPPHSYYKCEKLPTTGIKKSDDYNKLMDAFQQEISKHHVDWYGSATVFGQADFYYRIGQEKWIKNVCEIGFNTGYSAIPWLAGSRPDRKVYFFDIGTLKYTPPMAAYFKKLFPGKFEMIVGDSTKTVWGAVKLFKKCDLVVVDGGHTFDIAIKDIMNIKKLANPKHHLLIMDDTPAKQHMTNVVKAWMWGQIEYGVQHLFGCTVDNHDRGFSVGVYRDLID